MARCSVDLVDKLINCLGFSDRILKEVARVGNCIILG
jgi:hypothetical protein